MKKAWDDIKSFITVAMTLAYIYLSIANTMTPDFQNLYLMIVAFYFGSQVEKIKQLKEDVDTMKQIKTEIENKYENLKGD